ncbi:phage polarity suppression protein [Edwardsiella tarda]|uniref:phage polarity suppression protein n=1 Tax=Edwardsiella tarda TaxID=636 RepID=UPI003F65C462
MTNDGRKKARQTCVGRAFHFPNLVDLREALAIEYAEASRDILNSAGLRPETAARQDAISRTTPAENLKFMHRKITLEQQRLA